MKSSETEYIELVKQAQQGNEESRNRLAEISRDRLRMYVYRLTLDADLTEDILQESMLGMFKFLDKLERTEGFWSWVLRIATNNVKDHYKREQRRRASDPDRTGIRHLLDFLTDQVLQALLSIPRPTGMAHMNAFGQTRGRHHTIQFRASYEELRAGDTVEEFLSKGSGEYE